MRCLLSNDCLSRPSRETGAPVCRIAERFAQQVALLKGIAAEQSGLTCGGFVGVVSFLS
jgi:hypothetical protein